MVSLPFLAKGRSEGERRIHLLTDEIPVCSRIKPFWKTQRKPQTLVFFGPGVYPE
jgi:hypothetical protein